MTKMRKTAALFVAVIFLCVISTSFFFLAYSAEHDCVGEQCKICLAISAFRDTIKLLACGVASGALLMHIIFALYKCLVYDNARNRKFTLFDLKVMLLN